MASGELIRLRVNLLRFVSEWSDILRNPLQRGRGKCNSLVRLLMWAAKMRRYLLLKLWHFRQRHNKLDRFLQLFWVRRLESPTDFRNRPHDPNNVALGVLKNVSPRGLLPNSRLR